MMSEKLEWHAVTLEEIAEITGGGTPKREVHAYWNGNIPWATPTDITNNNKKVIEKTAEYITEEGLKNSSAKLLPAGTVLMTSRATIGYCAINTVPMATNQGFANFICKNNVYNLFLLYLLTFHKDNFEKLGSGSTFKEVAKSTLKSYRVEIPPLPEQRKIAAILSSVDEAIEKTEAIIEQTEKVKKGLMQQLLTKGIGHTKFKKTEIGEIPEEWDIKRLEELSDRIFVGIATSTTEHYCETGIPIIRNQNIKENFLDSNDMMFITEHFDMENRNKKLKPGDILTVRTGYPGTSCVVPDSFEGAQTFTTLVTRPKHSIIDAEFLCRYINSHIGKKYVLGGQVGGAQKNLNVSVMAKLPVPVPPMNEQKKIRDILISFENKILCEKHQLETLENLKKSLMQSLLTGKVRVKVDEDEVMSS